MKIASNPVLAAILFSAIAVMPLHAQANMPAENGTNLSETATNVAAATNAAVAAGTETQKSSVKSTPVQIDENGIHVGGDDPVDIKIPGLAKSFGLDKIGHTSAADLLVPLAPFVMVVAVLAIVFYFKHRRNQMMNETLRAMIEKGMPITPEMIVQLQSKPSRFSDQPAQYRNRRLLPGLILTGVGAAFLITNMGRNSGDSKAGLLLLFMGAAFLIVWLVERKDGNNNQPPKP